MESRLKNLRRVALRAVQSVSTSAPASPAAVAKRRAIAKPPPTIAVIDIGSNSVRLVVYEQMTRSPAPTFNEKVLCGLGREVQSTGLLAADAVEKALAALKRFRALCKVMKVGRIHAIATAACRDASNGADFIAKAERICGTSIEILSGEREARLSALGVVSGVYKPDGIVGDLGGGSLELIDVKNHQVRRGVTLPLGGLALQDSSKKSMKRAERIVEDALADVQLLKAGKGRTLYAVGGTWRALARIHIIQSGYPLRVMHGYSIPASEALPFARRVRELAASDRLANMDTVAEARRPLVAYAALVLEHLILAIKPKTIVFSTYGVREGLLFEMLPEKEQQRDGLMATAEMLNALRSRSARHSYELIDWTDRFVKAASLTETESDRRLRHAACLLSDIGWRAHPDYRGEQTLNLVMHGHFGAVDHQSRAFLALAIYYRYAGFGHDNAAPVEVTTLVPPAMIERARILGALFRVAHLISAAQPGVLPLITFRNQGHKLLLIFGERIADLAADRVANRFKQLMRMLGRGAAIVKG